MGRGPLDPGGKGSPSLERSSPRGLAGGHRGASEPHHAPAARACTPQSAPPVGTQSACRRLTVCSRSRDPSPLARRRSVGLALTLRLPQEDALHLPLPCPRPPVLTSGTLPAAVCPCTGACPSGGTVCSAGEQPGSPRVQRAARKPRGEARERSQACGRSPWHWVTRSGVPSGALLTQQTGSPTAGAPHAATGTAASGVSKGCKRSQQQPRREPGGTRGPVFSTIRSLTSVLCCGLYWWVRR